MPVYILEMENKVTKCIIFVIPKTKPKDKPHRQKRQAYRISKTLAQISSLVMLCTSELCGDCLTSWRGQRQLYKSDI